MKTLAIAAALAATLAVAPASAQEDRQIAVRHADLDLTTAAGQATLDLRLLHAARTVCGTPSPADAQGQARTDACVAELVAATAPQRAALVAFAQRQANRSTLASR